DVVEVTLPPAGVRAWPLPVRGLAVRGRGAELAEALAETGPIVVALESYFGLAHPYPKLDLIAAPEYPAGAMENAGAVIFREASLLVNPATAGARERRNIAVTIAHEIAHQWFGDLVTMAWWDDLWLNEAFAEWLGLRIVGR